MRLSFALLFAGLLGGCASSGPPEEDVQDDVTVEALKCSKHRYLGKMGGGIDDKDLERQDKGGYETFANYKSCDDLNAYTIPFVQRTRCSTGFRVDRRKGTIYGSRFGARVVYEKWDEWVFDRELCLLDAQK